MDGQKQLKKNKEISAKICLSIMLTLGSRNLSNIMLNNKI